MTRFLLTPLVVLALFIATAQPAAADVGGEDTSTAEPVLADSERTIVNGGQITSSSPDFEHNTVSNSAPVCAIWGMRRDIVAISEEPGFKEVEVPFCEAHYDCHGERIDDIMFGRISNGSTGAYAEYVDDVGTMWEAVLSALFGSFTIDRGDLAVGLAEDGLGERATSNQMPVFYYCREGVTGPIELMDPSFTPYFGWTTTVEENYNITTVRWRSVNTLNTLLRGQLPQIQTVPPVEAGHTFVQVPMWLWLDNIDDLVGFTVEATNDLNTVRLSTRATLSHVEFVVNGEWQSCSLQEMQPFIHGVNSLQDPTPACSYMFTQSTSFQITATAVYVVEEQLAFRGSSAFPWPEEGWTPAVGGGQARVPNSTGTLEARQILSVNAAPDFEPED